MVYNHYRILWEIVRYTAPFLCYHVGWERGGNFKGLGDPFNFIHSRGQIVFHVNGYLLSLYKHGFAFTKGNAFYFLCAILTIRFTTNKCRFYYRASTAGARKRKDGINTFRHKTPQDNQLVQPLPHLLR